MVFLSQPSKGGRLLRHPWGKSGVLGEEILVFFCREVRFSTGLAAERFAITHLLQVVQPAGDALVGCRTCEANCHNGYLKIEEGKIDISNDCVKCLQCHQVEKGCLVFKSVEVPKGGQRLNQMSLNSYSHHAPRIDWLKQFFTYKDSFDQSHSLGSQMYSFFRRFLRDAQLIDNNSFSYTATVIEKMGLENQSSWGIMLANLAYTPQISWYVKNIGFGEECSKSYVTSLLVNDGAKESWVNDVWSSFGRFHDLPFSEVGIGVNNTAIVQDKTYHGESEDQHNFVISMPDVRRSGDYVLDVYVDRALVWRGLKFSVEKEGFKENALF